MAGSHKQWAEGFAARSCHQVEVVGLPGKNWKWRMHGAAVTFAELVNARGLVPDVIVATDMLDVATFRGLCNQRMKHVPVVLYFHENQLTYPWSARDKDARLNRDNHYGFINYTSALSAELVLFNSDYHQGSFLGALTDFLKQFPDNRNLNTVGQISAKSKVLHLGMDLKRFDRLKPAELDVPDRATILWNHRWEYDKNPDDFFQALFEIQDRGWDFNLIVLGEGFKDSPSIFSEARERLRDKILHWGFVESMAEYAKWLWLADILPVTSNQDFFGGSVVEAMYCNVKPLLPKRLAYPEHIPEFLHHVFFYEENEFVDKLQRWIKDVPVLRKQQTRSFVERYDWSVLIGQYEEMICQAVISHNH